MQLYADSCWLQYAGSWNGLAQTNTRCAESIGDKKSPPSLKCAAASQGNRHLLPEGEDPLAPGLSGVASSAPDSAASAARGRIVPAVAYGTDCSMTHQKIVQGLRVFGGQQQGCRNAVPASPRNNTARQEERRKTEDEAKQEGFRHQTENVPVAGIKSDQGMLFVVKIPPTESLCSFAVKPTAHQQIVLQPHLESSQRLETTFGPLNVSMALFYTQNREEMIEKSLSKQT